eukprot:scaffold31139_cov53-Phaeocystis_antarctica.AAC.1
MHNPRERLHMLNHTTWSGAPRGRARAAPLIKYVVPTQASSYISASARSRRLTPSKTLGLGLGLGVRVSANLEDGEEEHGGWRGSRLQHARQRTTEERTDAALLAHLVRVRVRVRVRVSTNAALLAHLCREQGLYGRPARPKAADGRGWPRLAEAGRGFGVPQRPA